jgi:chromosome segregation ATPase
MLQNQLSNNTNSNNISNDYKHMNSSNILKNAELTDENEKLKKEILETNKKIEQLETDINNIKKINNQLIKEINELKGNYQNQNIDNDIRQSAPEERISITIDNLKEELKDKNLQIEKLIQENNNLKNNIKKNNNNNLIINDDDEKEIKNEINPFRTTTTLNNLGLSDAEKIKIYKEQIKELKLLNDSDSIQIRTLKVDIKEMKEKIQKMETFSGQLKNFDEFISLLNLALFDYRPKKKEQKDALNRLIEVMNNHHV